MIFDVEEFEMLLYGLPFINLDDWESHTQYKGKNCSAKHQNVLWFWQVLREFD